MTHFDHGLRSRQPVILLFALLSGLATSSAALLPFVLIA